MPSITNLKYLLALREQLHFAKAATQCFVSQSTLSAGIKKLEQDLGVILFERNNKKVVITSMGEKISVQAEQIFFSMQNLERVANLDFFTSEITIGVIPTISAYLIPHMMRTIKKVYPYLSITIIEDTSSNLLHKIEYFEIDFAIFAFPFESSENIIQHHVFIDNLYRIQHKDWSDTTSENKLLILEQGHCLREHIMDGLRIENTQLSNFSCSSLEMIIAMVDMQVGMSFIPSIAVDNGILDKYPHIIATITELSRDVGIVYHSSNIFAEYFLQLSKFMTTQDEY